MSKYLKVSIFLLALLRAEDFELPMETSTIQSTSRVSSNLKEMKARFNRNRDGYNYINIRNQKDYNRWISQRGNNLGLNSSNKMEMINVVKIKNVRDKGRYLSSKGRFLHKGRRYDKNLGIQYTGDASHKNITNLVSVENSKLNGRVNSGTSINSSKNIVNTTITNQTSVKNSSIGNKNK
jgi:hypothetical protein